MGNVVSAVLMYALQVAWMCQRLIDQDYRQNYGSRMKPIMDDKYNLEVDVFLPKCSSTPILSRSPHHKSKLATNNEPATDHPGYQVMPRKSSASVETSGNVRRRKDSGRVHTPEETENSKPEIEETDVVLRHPRLAEADVENSTTKYVNNVRQKLGFRRAFSDININSSCYVNENLRTYSCDDNHNYLDDDNFHDTMISTAEEEILRLVVSRGCVTEGRNDFSVYSVL